MTCYISAGWDFAKIGSFTLHVQELDGDSRTITYTNGRYCHVDISTAVLDSSDYGDFATRLETSLNSGGGLLLSGSYTVTYNQATAKYTIVCDESFRLGTGTNLLARDTLGIDSSPTNYGLSYTSEERCFYALIGNVAGISDDTGVYENGTAASDFEADSNAVHYGLSKASRPLYREFKIPMEPKERTYKQFATDDVSTIPWSYEHFFEHVRAFEPFYVNTGIDDFACRLRARGAAFKPERVVDDWDDRWTIPFK